MTQRFAGATGMPIAPQSSLEPPPPSKADQPLREILVELWENTEKLVRQEIRLASTELDIKAQKFKADAKAEATAFALGGAFLHAALLAAVAGVILLLAQAVAAWLSALIVGAVLAGVGYMLLKRSPQVNAEELTPERTIESVKKDVQTFTEATK